MDQKFQQSTPFTEKKRIKKLTKMPKIDLFKVFFPQAVYSSVFCCALGHLYRPIDELKEIARLKRIKNRDKLTE